MKAKFLILIMLSTLIFSCESDDNEIRFSKDNSLYIGTLYKIYLTDELESIAQTITTLQAIIDNNQGTPEIEQQLAEAIQEQDNLNVNFNSIVGFDILPPLPPCPGQNNECLLPPGFNYVIDTAGAIFYEINIFNQQNQLIGNTVSQSKPLPNFEGEFVFKEFNFLNQFSGSVIVKVKMTDASNNTIEFEIEAEMP
jgi:hypothetical protein